MSRHVPSFIGSHVPGVTESAGDGKPIDPDTVAPLSVRNNAAETMLLSEKGHAADYGTSNEPVAEEDFEPFAQSKISAWQAAWNVTNAIQGMFVVSFPYAVLHGGWWAVLALVVVAYICYHTGLMLVQCLYDENGVRVRSTYRAVAEAVWGAMLGGRIVLTAQLIELLMTCILYIVLTGDLLQGSFPEANMNKSSWMVMATIALLPCALLTDIRAVSHLSFWNTVSHVIINAIVIVYCVLNMRTWAWASVRFTVNMQTFPTVLGIVVFSYTDHIFLPTLEGNMQDRTQFKPMLKMTHIAAAIFKAIFGLVGFLTFAQYTQEEVSNNLPSQTFKICLNTVLVFKALLSYPLPFYATARIMEENLFQGPPKTVLPCAYGDDKQLREWALGIRVCLVAFTLIIALIVPHFALLMGLIGNITGTMLSFVWPSYFHLRLCGAHLSTLGMARNYTIIAVGLLFGSVGIWYSSKQLNRAMNMVDEYE